MHVCIECKGNRKELNKLSKKIKKGFGYKNVVFMDRHDNRPISVYDKEAFYVILGGDIVTSRESITAVPVPIIASQCGMDYGVTIHSSYNILTKVGDIIYDADKNGCIIPIARLYKNTLSIFHKVISLDSEESERIGYSDKTALCNFVEHCIDAAISSCSPENKKLHLLRGKLFKSQEIDRYLLAIKSKISKKLGVSDIFSDYNNNLSMFHYTEELIKLRTKEYEEQKALLDNITKKPIKINKEEILRIKSLDKIVADLCLTDNKIVILTQPVVVEFEKAIYNLGKYQISINFDEPNKNKGYYLSILPNTNPCFSSRSSFFHPHIGYGGVPCLGNVSEDFYNLYASNQFYVLVIYIWEFLHKIVRGVWFTDINNIVEPQPITDDKIADYSDYTANDAFEELQEVDIYDDERTELEEEEIFCETTNISPREFFEIEEI